MNKSISANTSRESVMAVTSESGMFVYKEGAYPVMRIAGNDLVIRDSRVKTVWFISSYENFEAGGKQLKGCSGHGFITFEDGGYKYFSSDANVTLGIRPPEKSAFDDFEEIPLFE